MATLPMSEKEKQDKEQQPSSEPVLGSPSGNAYVTPTSGGAAAPQTGSSPKPTSSGSYTNLMSYINANNSGGGRMGQAVRSNVDNQAGQAQQNLEGWKNTASSAVDQGTTKLDQNVVSGLQNDPTKVDANAFQSQYNAQYKGPQSADYVDGYGNVQQDFNKIGEKVSAAGGDLAAKSGLVKDVFSRPSYSRGEQRMDGFILGTSQQGQQQLKGLQDSYGNFGSNFTNSVADVNNKIQQGTQASDQTRQTVRDAYGQASGAARNTITGAQSKLAEQNAANTKAYQDTAARLTNTRDQAARTQAYKDVFGLDDTTSKYLIDRGLDPNTVLSANGPQALGDVVGGQDQARYSALRNLIGMGSEFDFSKTGNTADAYKVDQNKKAEMAALRDLFTGARTTNDQQNKAITDRNAQLQLALERVMNNDVGGIAGNPYTAVLESELGINPKLIENARAAGVDMRPYFKAAQAAKLGDSVNEAQTGRFNEILKTLGITGGNVFDKANPAGASFDSAGLGAAVQKRLAEIPREVDVADVANGGLTPAQRKALALY